MLKDGYTWPGVVLAHILSIPAVNLLPIPLWQPAAGARSAARLSDLPVRFQPNLWLHKRAC